MGDNKVEEKEQQEEQQQKEHQQVKEQQEEKEQLGKAVAKEGAGARE